MALFEPGIYAVRNLLKVNPQPSPESDPSPAPAPLPFAIGNDAASAATRGMGAAGFLLTARAPVSRVIAVPPLPPLPTPVPTPTPEPRAN